jgi:hypothetical protein
MTAGLAAREGGPITLRIFVLWIALPYFIGLYYSKHHLAAVRGYLASFSDTVSTIWMTYIDEGDVVYSEAPPHVCLKRLKSFMFFGYDAKYRDEPFANLTVVVHKNGEAQPFGRTTIDVMEGFAQLLHDEPGTCPINFENHQLDALLTRLFRKLVPDWNWEHYCDAGPARTPILPDHERLVAVPKATAVIPPRNFSQAKEQGFWSCHFHTDTGVRLTDLPTWAQLARQIPSSCVADEEKSTITESNMHDCTTLREMHLVAVPAGRLFQFAASHVGQIIPLPHIVTEEPEDPDLYLSVLSINPRIFQIHNLFSRRVADDLIQGILQEERPAYRLQRSTTGAAKNQDTRRTSESGFDTHSPTAMSVKRRALALLGFWNYVDSFTDGLQILRYQPGTAYNEHMDWMQGGQYPDHDLDATGVGGNRWATILLYLSDLAPDEGGETLFGRANEDENERVGDDAVAQKENEAQVRLKLDFELHV